MAKNGRMRQAYFSPRRRRGHIAPSLLYEYVPLQHDPKGGKIITQYDMYAIEDAGLLKFDFWASGTWPF